MHTFFFHVFITLIQFFSSSCLNVKCFLKKGKKLYIPHILFQKFTTFFISLSISVTTFPHESSYIGWNQYRKFGRRKFSDSEIKHTDNQTNWFNWIKAGENWNLKIIFSCWITQVNQSVHFLPCVFTCSYLVIHICTFHMLFQWTWNCFIIWDDISLNLDALHFLHCLQFCYFVNPLVKYTSTDIIVFNIKMDTPNPFLPWLVTLFPSNFHLWFHEFSSPASCHSFILLVLPTSFSFVHMTLMMLCMPPILIFGWLHQFWWYIIHPNDFFADCDLIRKLRTLSILCLSNMFTSE